MDGTLEEDVQIKVREYIFIREPILKEINGIFFTYYWY